MGNIIEHLLKPKESTRTEQVAEAFSADLEDVTNNPYVGERVSDEIALPPTPEGLGYLWSDSTNVEEIVILSDDDENSVILIDEAAEDGAAADRSMESVAMDVTLDSLILEVTLDDEPVDMDVDDDFWDPVLGEVLPRSSTRTSLDAADCIADTPTTL